MILTLALAPIRVAPAAAMFFKSSKVLIPPEAFTPKISIHIPAHREPPEMLVQTLDAVARLDYPNFECVIVIIDSGCVSHARAPASATASTRALRIRRDQST